MICTVTWVLGEIAGSCRLGIQNQCGLFIYKAIKIIRLYRWIVFEFYAITLQINIAIILI